jgi:hypothetical protein
MLNLLKRITIMHFNTSNLLKRLTKEKKTQDNNVIFFNYSWSNKMYFKGFDE